MRVIATAISEIWHLFVEDGPFAAAIVLWPCLIWVFDCRAQLTGMAGSVTLAVGMVVILMAGALRHKHPRRPR